MANLKYSNIDNSVAARRSKLKAIMDDFCTFGFDNIGPSDMFDKYGAFIINDKNSLKFYNGPGFSNDYTKPQFAKYNQLAGVTFKTQQIKFKIGLYWFDIQTYRQFFIDVLNPLKIGNLVFSFSPNWCYQVKLASVADSTRYIIGRYGNGTGEDQYAYYTEMDVTWDIQGEACARSVEPCLITTGYDNSAHQKASWMVAQTKLSDLPTPFNLSFDLDFTNCTGPDFVIQILAQYQNTTTTLARFTLYNWVRDLPHVPQDDTTDDPIDNYYIIHLTYNSETGTIYYTYGNTQFKILSGLNSTASGKKLVKDLQVNKFVYPGYLDRASDELSWNDIQIQVQIVTGGSEAKVIIPEFLSLETYERTNIL